MKRKKKIFTGVKPIGGHAVRSLREARRITSKFHELNNEIGLLDDRNCDNGDGDNEEDRRIKKLKILQEIEELGGRNRYQQASVVTTSHHKTSKWVISSLRKLGIYRDKSKVKLNTLEVGAINIQLQQYSGLNVRSIDINSQHPSIEELDFFELIPQGSYDLIVCSMVVNCVSTPELRAEMLTRLIYLIDCLRSSRLSLHLTPMSGILCLVLPTRCVKGSDTNDDSAFLCLLRALNLCTPSADRFPSLSLLDPLDLDSILLHRTPKLSFYLLMHSPIIASPTLALPSSQVLQSWILQVPIQSSSDNNTMKQTEVSENSLRNFTELLTSLHVSLFIIHRKQKTREINPQMFSFLNEDSFHLLSKYFSSLDLSESRENIGSISGFIIHLPESLIRLLLPSPSPP